MTLTATAVFLFCFLLGSYLDLTKGLIYDVIPLTGFIFLFTFWTQNVTNMLILTGFGLVLYALQLMGWADIEYLLMSAAFLYFVDVLALLLGMGTAIMIYMETQRKRNKDKIRLIPVLFAGNILSYLLYLL